MNQPGPVPQNTPAPEMQMEANPEEMMGMAEGGITSMDIDPRMFNFDGGGIVTFANPEKEKKQQDIKWKFIEQSGVEEFIAQIQGDDTHGEQAFIDTLRERIGRVREKDTKIKEFVKAEKKTDNVLEESHIWKTLQSYFKENSIVINQIESFNDFITVPGPVIVANRPNETSPNVYASDTMTPSLTKVRLHLEFAI
jgi:hypothetical protein